MTDVPETLPDDPWRKIAYELALEQSRLGEALRARDEEIALLKAQRDG